MIAGINIISRAGRVSLPSRPALNAFTLQIDWAEKLSKKLT